MMGGVGCRAERGTGASHSVRLWITDVVEGVKWVFVNLRASRGALWRGGEGGEQVS
jgi:hypothetical protein